ncbi:MAG: PEPxxWA-CTERM sorting domain-containing protein [Methylobacteriaceae bacterium]|nr:PEPxxWA-CTERM sorting domain-containing protein [Methylobacteriaceae bacterium]
MRFKRMLAAAAFGALLSGATTAQAGVVFFQDFESLTPNTLSLTTLPGFTVSGSTVDVVGAVNPYGITASSNVIDLDGTPGPATILMSSAYAFNAGDIVSLSFLLGGAQRGSVSDNFKFGANFSGVIPVTGLTSFGVIGNIGCGACSLGPNNENNYNLAGNTPFTNSGMSFTAAGAGTIAFYFGTSSRDNIGPLLDNVKLDISAGVPEPSTWAMMLIGFAGLGLAARRRRRMADAAA